MTLPSTSVSGSPSSVTLPPTPVSSPSDAASSSSGKSSKRSSCSRHKPTSAEKQEKQEAMQEALLVSMGMKRSKSDIDARALAKLEEETRKLYKGKRERKKSPMNRNLVSVWISNPNVFLHACSLSIVSVYYAIHTCCVYMCVHVCMCVCVVTTPCLHHSTLPLPQVVCWSLQSKSEFP